jgi:hypothetical protein
VTQPLPGIVLRLGDEPLASETTMGALGPWVVVVVTAIPILPLTLLSTFIGADDIDTSAVHVCLAERPNASREHRSIPRRDLPVTHARELCLLDHADRLLAHLKSTGRTDARVDVTDEAIAAAQAI